MDQGAVQARLEALYARWKAMLLFTDEEGSNLSPPLLLHVTEAYCRAERRILFLGKETKGWDWDSTLHDKRVHPKWTFPRAWPFQEVRTCTDFRANKDSVEALCWGYQEFKFGLRQPELNRSALWRAFNEVGKWSDASVMWSNVVRMDYQGGSIWNAPQSLRDALLSQQVNLIREELTILEPHVCLFFSGPDYDDFIKTVFSNCGFLACGDAPVRELARLSHPGLPLASFRTYHPRYLRPGKRWHYIEALRTFAYGS